MVADWQKAFSPYKYTLFRSKYADGKLICTFEQKSFHYNRDTSLNFANKSHETNYAVYIISYNKNQVFIEILDDVFLLPRAQISLMEVSRLFLVRRKHLDPFFLPKFARCNKPGPELMPSTSTPLYHLAQVTNHDSVIKKVSL